MDVKFIDTSEWQILRWLSSGGTREKRILQDANDSKWYFKCSERKPASLTHPEKHYKYEFWSEVIAYQLGKLNPRLTGGGQHARYGRQHMRFIQTVGIIKNSSD